MRRALVVALLLAGCVSAEPPVEPTSLAPIPFTLDAGGIQPAGTDLRIDFGRAQAGVIETVDRLQEAALIEVVAQGDCGAGPVTAARWEDGLVLNFQDGDFRGWVATDASGAVVTNSGLSIGTRRSDIPAAVFTETSLGTEFQTAGVFGLMDDSGDQVAFLWSGLTCFFR